MKYNLHFLFFINLFKVNVKTTHNKTKIYERMRTIYRVAATDERPVQNLRNSSECFDQTFTLKEPKIDLSARVSQPSPSRSESEQASFCLVNFIPPNLNPHSQGRDFIPSSVTLCESYREGDWVHPSCAQCSDWQVT